MKILVFSDSHGKRDRIESVIKEHLRLGKIDCIFFLGDGLREVLDLEMSYPQLKFEYVKGNCDDVLITNEEKANTVNEKLVKLGGFTFMLMHGHKYDVKNGYQDAADHAIDKQADVLLFGHTHRAEDITIDGSWGGHVHMINPGSCGAWLGGSFVCLDIVGRDIVCGFGSYGK